MAERERELSVPVGCSNNVLKDHFLQQWTSWLQHTGEGSKKKFVEEYLRDYINQMMSSQLEEINLLNNPASLEEEKKRKK